MERMLSYRHRLRRLCEDFALLNKPRSMKEMFKLWKKGLKETEWERVVEIMKYSPMKRMLWSELEIMYAVEKVAEYALQEPLLREMTFVLRNEGSRTLPDFQTWYSLGYLFTYAHDRLDDHIAWIDSHDRQEFYWNAVYVRVIPPPDSAPQLPPYVGIQFDELGFRIGSESSQSHGVDRNGAREPNVPMEDDVEEEEEEEEEDPEEEQEAELEVRVDRENVGEAMEVDLALHFPPTFDDRQEDDQIEWTNIYPIGEGPLVADLPVEENEPERAVAPSETVDDQSGRARAREAIRRRRNYFRQFVPRRRGGSSSRNPDDTPSS